MRTILKIFLLFFCVSSYAQTTIKGTVTDDSGQPLPGANIIIVGTSTGTMTDFDGKYTLNTSQLPPFTIQVSSVGFETQTKEATSKSKVLRIERCVATQELQRAQRLQLLGNKSLI